MAQFTPALKFQVEPSIYDTNTFRDEDNFYHQKQGSVSSLTRSMTYILGKHTNKYPISLMTIGATGFGDTPAAKKASQEIDDVQFDYPVMSRMEKVSVSAGTTYSAPDKPGLGGRPFKIRFTDNHIKRFQFITNGAKSNVYIHDDGVEIPGVGFEYTAQINPCLPSQSIDVAELAYGVLWTNYTVGVAESQSRTTETTMKMPGSYKNQMGFTRLGTSWGGNAANKVMKISIDPMDGSGPTDVWMDWALWQFEQEWLSNRENNFWYSQYNREANGNIALRDMLTKKTIPRGAGILEQITNKTSTAELTYNFIAGVTGDALYNVPEAAGKTITFMGGKGAKRDFHRAMMKESAVVIGSTDLGNVADKFISGTGYNLALGGFFTTMYHIDGYIIKFKEAEVFNTGKFAQVSPKHPVTGFPLESHRLVCIDDSDEDGMMNIQHVSQKGRSFVQGIMKGLTTNPKGIDALLGNADSGSLLISTDMDQSSYTRLASDGIQLMRGYRCFDIECTAGL